MWGLRSSWRVRVVSAEATAFKLNRFCHRHVVDTSNQHTGSDGLCCCLLTPLDQVLSRRCRHQLHDRPCMRL